MKFSYHLAIVYLWYNMHNPKEDEIRIETSDENVTKY